MGEGDGRHGEVLNAKRFGNVNLPEPKSGVPHQFVHRTVREVGLCSPALCSAEYWDASI